MGLRCKWPANPAWGDPRPRPPRAHLVSTAASCLCSLRVMVSTALGSQPRAVVGHATQSFRLCSRRFSVSVRRRLGVQGGLSQGPGRANPGRLTTRHRSPHPASSPLPLLPPVHQGGPDWPLGAWPWAEKPGSLPSGGALPEGLRSDPKDLSPSSSSSGFPAPPTSLTPHRLLSQSSPAESAGLSVASQALAS